ncbi:MAG TPA: ring-cleaving dioxygenase [Ktedonobacterales bacterium]|nr:ring-cleaving dioxygenase [Ktedonobacterales bacterium]
MEQALSGIHHVTAIASDPQRNVAFYTQSLGLRLVKVTINYDDPTSYHLYYGDSLGRPGTILTFFAWPGGQRGRQGTGQAAVAAFTVPLASLGHWMARLGALGIKYEGPAARFDEKVLTFRDPDGLALELVSHPDGADRPGWEGGPVPVEHAIRGIHNVTLWVDGDERTTAALTLGMGLRELAREGMTTRFAAGAGGPGALVDVRDARGFWRGEVAVGTVHHVAWRTPDDAAQLAWRASLAAHGLRATQVMDRQYFHSIYYREPGGVLFEIATDPPGFGTDEAPDQLGSDLRLPSWLESQRTLIAAGLPRLRLPSGAVIPLEREDEATSLAPAADNAPAAAADARERPSDAELKG